MMIDNKRIGRAIRTLREKAGYTQKELAEMLFISDMAVSKWETGKSIPDVAILKKMAVILDMDVDGLLDGTASWLDDNWAGILKVNERLDLPLYDKPLIDYIISYFLLAGIKKIYLYMSEEQSGYIRDRFCNGESIGIQLCNGPDYIAEENYMVISAPIFLYGVDLTRFMQRAMRHSNSIVNLKTVIGENDKKTMASKPESSYNYCSIPIHFCRNIDWNCNTPIYRVLDIAKSENYYVEEPMDKGFVFSELKTAEDIKNVESLIKSIQSICGYLIYCPLEIAWRRGMIDSQKMLTESRRYCEYEEYISSMADSMALPLNSPEDR